MNCFQAPADFLPQRLAVAGWSMIVGQLLLSGGALAETVPIAPLVVPADGEPFPAELESISPDGRVTFRATQGEVVDYRTLPLASIVRWSNPASPKPQILVLLEDGSRLVTAAEWSGGAPARLEGD